MQKKKRLQNIVAESRFSLPITALYSILVWLIMDITKKELILPFMLIIVATYLMVELNNRNALIRIYSRIVSCSFLMLTMMANFVLPDYKIGITAVCTIIFYLKLFQAYQDKNSMGTIFYGFTFIGIASIWWIHIIYFVPVFWIVMGAHVMCLNIRTFFASLLGLTLPYWFLLGYVLYIDNFPGLIDHFTSIANLGPFFKFSILGRHEIITFAFTFILMITGMIHFIRKAFNDSIRVRMVFEAFIFLNWVCVAFMIIQPQQFNTLLMMLIINTVPLISHYIALTKTKITNFSFMLMIITILYITAYNLWIP